MTWFAYCLHAAVFNGVFCVLAWVLLRSMAAPPAVAVFYAALSGLVFYPPSGTPYMEQHAFFFVLAAVTLLYTARDAGPTRRRPSWTAVPFCVVLAFLSKQNVATLALPCFAVACAAGVRSWRELASLALWMAAGMAACAVILAVTSVACGVDPGKVRAELFEMPYRIGQERVTHPYIRTIFWARRLLSAHVLALAMLASAGFYSVASRVPAAQPWRQALRDAVWDFSLVVALMTFSVMFVLTTANQAEGGFPYLFIALGILHTRAGAILSATRAPSATNWVQVGLLAVALIDAAHYGMLNAARGYQDIQFDPSAARRLTAPALQFLEFQTDAPLSAAGFDAIITFLQATERNFFLVGDSAILYGVTGKPSLNPYLWFHAE